MARQGRRSPRRRNRRQRPDAKSTEWSSVGNIPVTPPGSCVITGREAASSRFPLIRRNKHFSDAGASTHEEETNAHGAAASGADLSGIMGKTTAGEEKEGVKSGTEAPDDSVVSAGAGPEVDPGLVGPMSSEEADEKHPPRFRAGERSPGEGVESVDSLDLWPNGASASEGQPSHSVNEKSDWPGGCEKQDTRRSKLEASEEIMGFGRPQRPVVQCREEEAVDLRTPWNPSSLLSRLATEKFTAEEMKSKERSDAEMFVDEPPKDSKAEEVALNARVLGEAATEDDVKHLWKEPHDVANLNFNPEVRVGCPYDGAPGSARAAAERPEDMRRCFVAKTFSPSDLGLGDNKKEASGDTRQHGRHRPSTILRGLNKLGIASLGSADLRKASIDQDFGFDETQVVLGDISPERLFSLTGMFHPEAPMKVVDQYLSNVVFNVPAWSLVCNGV